MSGSNPFSKAHYTTVRDQVGGPKGGVSAGRRAVQTDRGDWGETANGGDKAIERTALKAESGGYSPFIDWEWVGCKSEKEFHRIQQEALQKRGLRANVQESFQRLEALRMELDELEGDVEAGASNGQAAAAAAAAGGGGGPGDGGMALGAAAAGSGGGTRLAGRVRDIARDLHDVADLLKVKPKGVLRGRFDAMFARLEKMRLKLGMRIGASSEVAADSGLGAAAAQSKAAASAATSKAAAGGRGAPAGAADDDSDDESFTDSVSEMSYAPDGRGGGGGGPGAVDAVSDDDGSSRGSWED
jgi:hypothetical protein